MDKAIFRNSWPGAIAASARGLGRGFAGVELPHMIRKGQFAIDGADAMSFADQLFALAGMVRSI